MHSDLRCSTQLAKVRTCEACWVNQADYYVYVYER